MVGDHAYCKATLCKYMQVLRGNILAACSYSLLLQLTTLLSIVVFTRVGKIMMAVKQARDRTFHMLVTCSVSLCIRAGGRDSTLIRNSCFCSCNGYGGHVLQVYVVLNPASNVDLHALPLLPSESVRGNRYSPLASLGSMWIKKSTTVPPPAVHNGHARSIMRAPFRT